MPRWVAKIEIARRAGVSRAAITKAARVAFPDAVFGNQVDLDHLDVQTYLRRRQADPTAVVDPAVAAATDPTVPGLAAPATATAAAPALVEAPAPSTVFSLPEPVAPYLDWTLRAIADKHGTMRGFEVFLVQRKKLGEIIDRDVKLAERLGTLIPRALVRTHVFAHIEGAYRRLLTDTVKSAVRRAYAACRANAPEEEAERIVHDLIGSQLEQLKSESERALRPADEPAPHLQLVRDE